MKKSKQGVYKKQTTKVGRSMAAAAMKDLLERTDSEFDADSQPGGSGLMTGSATNEGALRELRRVGLEKQKAWDAVPSLKEVLEEAERARDAAATEDWLDRAHEIMTSAPEDEKDWARDQNDDLFLVSRQAAARRRVPAPARPAGGGGGEVISARR